MEISSHPSDSPDFRILELAKKLESDIKAKKLKPGDSYLTTAECAKLLGGNTAMVNKALQLLSTRHILRRGRRIGTVITKPPDSLHPSPLSTIHVVMEPFAIPAHASMDDILIGIQSAFPDACLKIKLLPKSGELVSLKRFLQNSAHRNETEGVLLISVSTLLQRACAESSLPTVAMGLPHKTVDSLPFVDWDAQPGGEKLVSALLEKRPNSLMVLTREHLFPRDHEFLDGVLKGARTCGFPVNQISIRCLENDEFSVRAAIATFLDTLPEPHAIVVTDGEHAIFADSIMRLRSRGKPQLIAIADCHFQHPLVDRYPHLRFDCTTREVGERAGSHLRLVCESPTDVERQCLIPVKMIFPKNWDRIATSSPSASARRPAPTKKDQQARKPAAPLAEKPVA